MLQSTSASGLFASTAAAASRRSPRTAQIFVAISARRMAVAWCLMRMRPPCVYSCTYLAVSSNARTPTPRFFEPWMILPGRK
jgi:hypothetical protein